MDEGQRRVIERLSSNDDYVIQPVSNGSTTVCLAQDSSSRLLDTLSGNGPAPDTLLWLPCMFLENQIFHTLKTDKPHGISCDKVRVYWKVPFISALGSLHIMSFPIVPQKCDKALANEEYAEGRNPLKTRKAIMYVYDKGWWGIYVKGPVVVLDSRISSGRLDKEITLDLLSNVQKITLGPIC